MKTSEKNITKTKIFKNFYASLLIILAATVFWGAADGIGLLHKFDYRLYDMMLLLRKAPVERPEVLLVDIDDLALDKMGEWPWTREKVADSLLMMKQLGARTVVFDIEYLSESAKGINNEVLTDIQKSPEQNAEKIYNLFVDNDEYFAKSLQFFGNSWLTINVGDLHINYPEEDIEYAKNRFLYQIEDKNNILDKKGCAKDYKKFSPAINKIISKAKGAGYTNVEIDSDGTRRRIKLLIKYADGAVAQLSFAPLLKVLNPEKIVIKKHHIVLQNCTMPDSGNKKTIRIPIAADGTMLINWQRKPYSSIKVEEDANGVAYEQIDEERTSFKHNSIYYLWHLVQLEKNIEKNLKLFNSVSPNENIAKLLSECEEIKNYKAYIFDGMNGYDQDGNPVGGGIDSETLADYFNLRQNYFTELYYFVSGEEFVNFANSDEIFHNQDALANIETFSYDIEEFINYFTQMLDIYQDKYCIIGNTGSGTTDMGANPFEKIYPNVGTHANVYNTILTEDFIYPLSWYWGVILSAILSLLALAFHSEKKFSIQTLWGIGLLCVVIAIPLLMMAFLNCYAQIASPTLIALTSYICITAYRFRASEKDKKFITGAFSQCLSNDVVQEIIKDPSKLVLGGKNFDMTAIFTDIQKFSGFSELLSADELVALLNFYLTKMSDIIIDEHGTVDKYEGDAIVAFVGAPVRMEDHANRACAAAIKMKKAEIVINQEILDAVKNEKTESYDPVLYSAFDIMVKNNRTIFTRIGINSGSIVAGFMGSENKKNYTVMGNNVNLASRLEGVNKQYSTNGILISEATRMALDDSFLLRSLDRVQVVNVKTPIRLYELIGFKSEADEKQLRYVAAWEQTMKVFESGNYQQALLQYRKLLEANPNDKVCKYYISLVEKFFVQGKYPVPQDDFGVAYNAENPADMDPSWIGTPKEIKGTFTLLQK